MDDIERKREKSRESARRHLAKKRAAGWVRPKATEKELEWQRNYLREKRAKAKAAGEALPGDDWHKRNPEKHLARVQRYRSEHPERTREVARAQQSKRRSTPWGQINNRLVAVLHNGVRVNSARAGKYTNAIGYAWASLRAHLEAQFTSEMTWENWGDVWELDHIKPLSLFQYISLEDPLLKECWSLSNLRPLLAPLNASKGSKHAA